MALSRPLMNFSKNFGSKRALSTSAQRFSEHGGMFLVSFFLSILQYTVNKALTIYHFFEGYKGWKMATYFFCIPVVLASTYINLGPNASHDHRPDFVPYDYLRIRTKVTKF